MKKSKLWLVPLLVAPILAGCGQSSSNEIVLKIWEDESNIETVRTLANEFIASYKRTYHDAPEIVLEFTSQPEKSAIEEMGTKAEAGEGPDIAAVTHDTIASGVGRNLVAPVSYVEELRKTMTEEALNAVTYNGVVYAYPITAESQTVIYNTDKVSAQELESFENLKAAGKKLAMQVTDDNAGYYTFGLYTDAVLFGEDGKASSEVKLDNPESVANVTDFYSNYLSCIEDASPEVGLNYVDIRSDVVGIVTSPHMLSEMKAKFPGKVGITSLPTLGGKELRPFSGYKAYVVSRYSKQGALAQQLAEFLTNYDAQAVRLIDRGFLPACHLDGTQDIVDALDASDEAKVFADSLSKSIVMPNIPQMNNFWKPMNTASTNFIRDAKAGNLTAQTVTSGLQAVANSILGISK